MKRAFWVRNLERIEFQKNVAYFIIFCLSLSLMVTSGFLFLKRDRVILIPPKIDRVMWVDGSNVSKSYLEQFSVFLTNMLMNKTKSTVSNCRDVILQYCSPEFFPVLRKKLLIEEEKIKKENLTYSFFFQEMQVHSENLSVVIKGKAIIHAGTKKVVDQDTHVKLAFGLRNERLEILSIEEVSS